MFDHEKLDVYQLQLQFLSWVTTLLDDAKDRSGGKSREICAQLDRASLSVLLNIAEGNGRRQRPTRGKFFDDARGSATECAACLDALAAKRIVEKERVREGKEMLVRVVAMLTKMVVLFEGKQSGGGDAAPH